MRQHENRLVHCQASSLGAGVCFWLYHNILCPCHHSNRPRGHTTLRPLVDASAIKSGQHWPTNWWPASRSIASINHPISVIATCPMRMEEITTNKQDMSRGRSKTGMLATSGKFGSFGTNRMPMPVSSWYRQRKTVSLTSRGDWRDWIVIISVTAG
jgi:hypothetical protein